MTLPIPSRRVMRLCLAPTRAQLAPGSRAGALSRVRMSALEGILQCRHRPADQLGRDVLPPAALGPDAIGGAVGGHHLGLLRDQLRAVIRSSEGFRKMGIVKRNASATSG